MEIPNAVAQSTESLFTEKDQVFELVEIVTNSSLATEEKGKALTKLRKIFDNYLECPSLLDPHIRDLISRLLKTAREIVTDVPTNSSENLRLEKCFHSFSTIYALAKVRGRKTIQRLLPHEVKDVEPVLQALQQLSQTIKNPSNQESNINSDEPQCWESLFVLWNWMGTLSLVPFDCSVVLGNSQSLLNTLIDLGKENLEDPGPIRDAAASCVAKWLSRPDLENTELPKFVEWGNQVLLEHTFKQAKRQPTGIFLVLGVLQTLVTILKVSTADREKLLQIMEPLWEPMLLLADSTMCDTNLMVRKYMVKWWSRMGCTYLPPRLASWRYQRGRRSLEQNLCQSENNQGGSEEGDGGNTASDQKDSYACSLRKDVLFDVPDQVEDAMGFILQSLRDTSTIVRWPAAKGVGRLTERLPSICADDVLDALLELFVDPGADLSWHGGCLALAELARRGLLLPHRLAEVVPLVVRAIQYDVRRGQTSVGTHVRDAACYTYWSFARAYNADVLKPYIPALSESIILTCLFDREVNCRRAASAAFQECVGRQGADNFKHGISILTAADYFAIGNREEAYTKIAFFVAAYQEYRRKIVNHVCSVKLQHWDESIRTLASKSLNGLTPLDKAHVVDVVFPSLLRTSLDPKNVPIRHGSILGLAEGILALGDLDEPIEDAVPGSILQQFTELVPTIEKQRLYRGRGGEMIRGAVCRFIQCLCQAKVPLIAKQQVRLLDSIDACLPHPNEGIQSNACDALGALTHNYFPVGPHGPSDRLQKRVVDKYISAIRTSENPAATRGFTLALGHLPSKLLAPSMSNLEAVLDTLSKVGCYDAKVGNEKDAETRRNALAAINRVALTVGLSPRLRRETIAHRSNHQGLDTKSISTIFTALLLGLEDYNIDRRRGDVGSWCRIEAMKGLDTFTCLVLEQAIPQALPELLTPAFSKRLIGGLLKQLSEKLDSVRVVAGRCLQHLLFDHGAEVPFIERRDYLKKCLTSNETERAGNINWADASITFPMVAKAAHIEAYFPFIIAGIVISVGGLTESVTKQSRAAFLQLAKAAKGGKQAFELANALLDLFQTHTGDGRVILPLLKATNILLTHRCLDEVIATEDYAFKRSLVMHLRKESRNSNDVHRHFACIDVALGMARPSKGPQEDDALAFACSQLVHRFPRVRRYAAEHLYVSLLEQANLLKEKHCGFEVEILLDFPWDGESTSSQQCRENAEAVATAVGVSLANARRQIFKEKKLGAKDDFATYSALVESISNN